jgi:hypothetical protein
MVGFHETVFYDVLTLYDFLGRARDGSITSVNLSEMSSMFGDYFAVGATGGVRDVCTIISEIDKTQLKNLLGDEE